MDPINPEDNLDQAQETTRPVPVPKTFDDYAVGKGSPLGGNTLDADAETKRQLDLDAGYMRQQFDMYAMSNRAYAAAQVDESAKTGADALRGYVKRMEDFQSALEKGDVDPMVVGSQMRADARNHAMTDGMFYESFHEGAWADARSMTSDEHTMFLGTDGRARQQYIHDSSEASQMAQALGLRNSGTFTDAIRERGIDPAQEGDWKDTITNLTGTLFNYENLMEDLGKRQDPDWTKDARDNAWSAMNATENGRTIIRNTEMTREALDRLPNQDSLIYVMNRKYKEMTFAQHASQDNLGGMAQTFGQMLPSIAADPDTVGELTLALLAAVPSMGTSVATYATLKAGGTGAKYALRMASVAKHVGRFARFTPTRVLGDFVVPFAKAAKDGKRLHQMDKVSDRMNYAWNNMEAYDNWGTFMAGAAADGFVGGAGSFLINASYIDDMNEQVYGRDQMPSVLTFDQLATRGLMGIGGAWALGGAIRKTMSMAGESVAMNAGKLYKKIHGMDKAEVQQLTIEGVYEKTLDANGVESDPAVVTALTASAERKSEIVGASSTEVAVRVQQKVADMDSPTMDDVNVAVNKAIQEVANETPARHARLLRKKQQAERAHSDFAKERADEDARADMNDLQTSTAVRSTEFAPDAKADDTAAKLEADADQIESDPDFDAILEARADKSAKQNDSAKAADHRRETKKGQKQRDKEAAEDKQLKEEEAARAKKEEEGFRKELEAAESDQDAEAARTNVAEAARRAQAASEAAEGASSTADKSSLKEAKKADRDASQAVHTASEVVKELTQKLAAKHGVSPETIESRITEAVSWRRVKAQRTYVTGVINAMGAEGLDIVPEGVLRHLLNNVNAEYARVWDAPEGDIDLATARDIVNEAARQQQLTNFNDLLNDPQAIYIGTRLTREAYAPLKEQLDALDAEGPGAAANAAAKLKMLAGGGNLRDFDFKGDGIYIKDEAYVAATLENMKEIESVVTDVFEVAGAKPADFEPGNGDNPELNRTLMVQELHSVHGFAKNQEFKDAVLTVGKLKELLGYMRWLTDIQKRIDSGELSGDILDGVGLDRTTQQAYLSTALVKLGAEIERLRENGLMPHMSEVEMYKLLPEYTHGSGRTGVGSNMRDGLVGDARIEDGMFDLVAVRNNLEERLARVDSDFDQARSAAAQAEIARLAGKVEDGSADFADRVRLQVYNKGNKVANEIDFLTNEILPAYRTLAGEAAAKKRAELGDEGFEAYLREQVRGIEEGIFDAFNGRSMGQVDDSGNPVINPETKNQRVVSGRPMNAQRRKAFYKKYGIPADAQKSMGDKFQDFLKDAVLKAAREELGFDLRALTNGTEGFSSGLQVGRAAVEMLTGQRTLTGDAPKVQNITSETKAKRGGETYAHVKFGADREANATGNLSVRKQVDFIQRYLLNETERQILFNADGTPRTLTEDQSKAVIEWYASLREMDADELGEHVPHLPFEQKQRQMTLAPRDPMGSPLENWRTIEQRVKAINDRLLRQPPMLIQGIHDDLTFAIRPGMTTTTAGFIGDAVTKTGQGAGKLHGYGAGWQTLMAVPGSVADWLNIRSSMVFRQFKGMDEFSRIMGLKALSEVAEFHAARMAETEGVSPAMAKKAGEVQSLIDLDTSVRMVQANMNNKDFDPEDPDIQNAWDASSQAVSLAKGLWGAINNQDGLPPAAVLDDVLNSMGFDKTNGLLNQETRMKLLADTRTVAEVGEALKQDDLAELAADFYSKVWDYMVDLPRKGKTERDAGRMQGYNKEGEVVTATSEMANPANIEMADRSRPVWDDLFEEIGHWGSKTDISAEKKAATTEDAQQRASMKKWLRDNLMKRPVMTRAYGAGGDAMTNAVLDFLEEAFQADTPEAKIFVNMITESDPAIAKQIQAEVSAGRRDKSTQAYAMASVLGWSFADAGRGSPSGQGERMGEALNMPDAKTFRDEIRQTAALHGDLFSANEDLRIPAIRYTAGEEKVQGGESAVIDQSQIRIDDLYQQRVDQDTAIVTPLGRDATAEDRQAQAEADAARTTEVNQARRDAVRQKSIEVAVRRGWDENADPELLATLGGWHLRNLLHVQGGVATEGQVRAQESAVMGELQKIIDDGGPDMNRKLEAYLENWLTKPDETILRSMNSVGLHPVRSRVETGLAGQNMGVDDLNPRLRYATETGTALHTTVQSSAGRQFNQGQGSKGDKSNEIFHVNRGNSDEVDGALNDFGDHAMKGWDSLTPEQRQERAMQLAAQDVMLEFAGMIKPPTHLIDADGVRFEEPTPAGWVRAVAENEGNAATVKSHQKEVRSNWTASKADKEGMAPDDSADILQDDVRTQVGSYHGQTIFNEVEPGVSSTDVGIPQMQVNKLSRTADQVLMQKLEAAAAGSIAGSGIRLSELAVPATLAIARDLGGTDVVDKAFVTPNAQMLGGFRMEEDAEWVARYTIREVTEYANTLGLDITTADQFREAFDTMTIERGYVYSLDRKLESYDYLDSKEEEDFSWDNAKDRTQFMNAVQNETNRLIEAVYGEPQVAAKKEAGHRNVHHLDDDKVAFPSSNVIDGLSKSFSMGGNRNNMDAPLGAAPRANMILGDGDQYIDGALLTGLMAKSVFHQDFAIGMGAAEAHYRFGMWFLGQKHPELSVEERALQFHDLFAKRLDDRGEYTELFNKYQAGEMKIDDGSVPNAMSSLLGLGAVRERLATDPVAMNVAREVFGIDKPEDLTDDVLIEMTRPVMSLDRKGEDLRLPSTYMDSLGRMLTSPHVRSGTVLWRTMAQYRAASIDPKSQPIIRRMWFAAMLDREVEKIDLRNSFGARNTDQPSFSMFNGVKVGEERIDLARKHTARVLGFKGGMEVPPNGGQGILSRVIGVRGDQALDGYRLAGLEIPGADLKDLDPKYDGVSPVHAPARYDVDAGRAAYLWEKTEGDWRKAEAIMSHSGRDTANAILWGDKPGVKEWFLKITEAKAAMNEEIRADMEEQIAIQLGTADTSGKWRRAYRAEQIAEIVDSLPGVNHITPAAHSDIRADVEGTAKGDVIFNGDSEAAPSDPVLSDGRALINDMDPIVRAKRHPQIDALTNELVRNGILSEEEGRKFAVLVAVNEDIVGELLPGMQFTYVGEAGGPRMKTTIDSAGKLQSRIKLTADMQGMDAIGAFDIIFHEIGHAVLHKAQAARTGVKIQDDPNGTQREISVLMSEFRNRALKSKEFQAQIVDTMIAIHGEERGQAMAAKFLQQILHAEKSGDRTDYSGGFQEFFAQMLSWHLLSRAQTLTSVTPFMKELGAIYRSGYGEKIRLAGKMMDADPSVGKGKDSVRRALTRLSQIAVTEAATTWKSKKPARFDDVVYNSPMRGERSAYETDLADAEAVLKDHPGDVVAMHKKLDAQHHLAEMGHGGFSTRDTHAMYLRAMDDAEVQLFAGAGLGIKERADLEARIKGMDPDGPLPKFQEFGVVNPRNLNPNERHNLTDHMLQNLLENRTDMFGTSGTRNAISKFAEGVAKQAHTQPWRGPIQELHLAANLLNPSKSFEAMSGKTRNKPISMQELSLFIANEFDRAQSAAVEVTKAVQKRATADPEFSTRVNNAFEDAFKSHGKTGDTPDSMKALEAEDPRVAEQVRIAATKFADAYDNAYKAAYRAGDIDSHVHKELLADRQLPVHLSEPLKNSNINRSTSYVIARNIMQEQLDRLDDAGHERHGFVNADILQQYGILAPTHAKSGADPEGRIKHVERLDNDPITRRVVDETIEWAKGRMDYAFQAQLEGASRADAFFYSSDAMMTQIRKGGAHAADLPNSVVTAYRAAMDPESKFDQDLAKSPNGEPYFMELIDRDFPDPDEARAVRTMIYSGDHKPTYADYIATKMLYRSRYGGYSFADSQFISADTFRAALRQAPTAERADGVDPSKMVDRGINRSPMAAIATFRPQAFAWHDKAINQNFYGVQGMGYFQMLAAVESKLDRGVMTKDVEGRKVEVKLNEQEIREARKALKVLREQAGAAMGRNPKYEADAKDDLFEAISPLAQGAIGLMTTPNWTSAALFSEGPAGVIKRARDIIQGSTSTFGGFSYFKDKGKMRDDLHAFGLALPYHMTQLGFGHIWHLGDDAAAAMDIDPTIAPSRGEAVNKAVGKVASFGFERVNLAQRHAMIEPSQDIMRRVLRTDADGNSKVRTLYRLIHEAGNVVDRKSLAKMAKKAGVTKFVAWQLYQQGVFQSEGRVAVLEELNAKYNHKGSPLKVEDMYGEIQSKFDKVPEKESNRRVQQRELAEEHAMAGALQSTIHHLITQTNMEPEAGARNVNDSPFGKIWGSLTSYALMFARNTMAATAGVGAAGLTAMISPLFFGEMVWYSLTRMKNGDSMQVISAEMAQDPMGFAAKALARMPIFGAGSFVSDTLISQGLGLVGKATDGAVFGSLAKERAYGMTMPGMPGVSMMLQFLSGMGDTMGKMTDYSTSAADKAAEAATFLSEIVPIDFRPVGLAAATQIKAEIEGDTVKAPGDRRSTRDATGTGFVPPRPPGGDKRPRFEQFADTYADEMVNSRIPLSQPPTPTNSAGGATTPPAREVGGGTPQAASAELSAPKQAPTSNPFGAGTASGDLADRK